MDNRLFKKTLVGGIQIASIVCLLAFSGCGEKETAAKADVKPSVKTFINSITAYRYRLDSALMDIACYDSLCNTLLNGPSGVPMDSVPIKAVTIRAQDLYSALKIQSPAPTDTVIRAYLGYRMGQGFKLFIVPVNGWSETPISAGIDQFFDMAGNIVPFPPGADPKGFYVMDLNAPCPNTCDPSSPLYQASMQQTRHQK